MLDTSITFFVDKPVHPGNDQVHTLALRLLCPITEFTKFSWQKSLEMLSERKCVCGILASFTFYLLTIPFLKRNLANPETN